MKAIVLLALPALISAQCVINIPADPLSAKGLATPFTVKGCDQTDRAQASFIEGMVYDPANNQVSVYSPLLINDGTKPAIMPKKPKLPKNAVVGLWFGSNADSITLTGPGLATGNCVNGLGSSLFGQVAFCNAKEWFAATQAVPVPPLGTAVDGKPCLTTRDFGHVDMDPSDNVVTQYLLSADKKLAQDTAANRKKLKNFTVLANGSDNRLLEVVDGVLGCSAFQAPNLADDNALVGSQALNELSAAKHQQPPLALVPLGDGMILVNGGESMDKLALYRQGVNQPPCAPASTKDFCQNLLSIGPARIQLDSKWTANATSVDPATGNNLFTFLCARLQGALGADGLNCVGLLNVPNPISTTTDANGVATSCTITLPN